jgi:hypothetical protein
VRILLVSSQFSCSLLRQLLLFQQDHTKELQTVDLVKEFYLNPRGGIVNFPFQTQFVDHLYSNLVRELRSLFNHCKIPRENRGLLECSISLDDAIRILVKRIDFKYQERQCKLDREWKMLHLFLLEKESISQQNDLVCFLNPSYFVIECK